MNNPIILAETAHGFNMRVRKNIDPRLFLFCNYEPTINYGTSDDAKYLIAIQDLYKFAVDSNYVLNHYWKFLPPYKKSEFESLGNILRDIQNLRAILDHNQSEYNGQIEVERIKWYQRWLEETLGKVEPEGSEDFVLLYQRLEKMATQLLEQVDCFLLWIERQSDLDRDNLVQEWLDQTLTWYTHNTKTDIYKGQLMDAYIAYAAERGKYIESKDINYKVKKWIENALRSDCERDKKEVDKIKRFITALDQLTPEQLARWESTHGQSCQWWKERWEKRLTEVKDQLEKKQKALNSLRSAVDYFFANLEGHLRETTKRLDREGRSYTLLPQDLMQEDIDFYFGGVPSPEGDF